MSTDKLEIIKINFDGTERELILDMNPLESEPIECFFAMDELIWLQCGTSIYRLHLSSNTLDKVYSNENLAWFKPISNYSVVCNIYTENWIEYIENGGDPDEQVLFHMTEEYIYNSATDDFYEPQYYDDNPNNSIIYEIEEDKNEN